jgi:5'-deoxynucleotidase YfbR-like HD superfamily hydrolase
MNNYWVQTYTGQRVDYLNPDLDTIKIEDIAKHLANECRFVGGTRFHYSVGHHSLLACGLAPKHLKLEGLLHDAEEYVVKDLPPQLVAAMSRGVVNQYKFIKNKFKRAIADKFKLNWSPENIAIIKEIDLRLAITERDALYTNPQPLCMYPDNVEPYNHLYNHIMAPEAMINIEKRFLDMFNMYRRDDGTEKIDIINLREDRN